MRPASGQGPQEHGRDRGQRLPFARRHLDDPATGEGEASQDLLVERPLPERPAGRLPGEREGLGELLVDLRAVGHAAAQRAGPMREPGVVELRHRGLESGDPGEHLPVGRQVALDRPAAQAIEKGGEAQGVPVYGRSEPTEARTRSGGRRGAPNRGAPWDRQTAEVLPSRAWCTTVSYMAGTITIRVDTKTERMLKRVVKLSGRTRSEITREALRRQLSLDLFEQLRRRVAPFAEAQGLLTDEDVFKALS